MVEKKSRALGETREERKEKREDPCRNNEQLNCNCTATGFARGPGREERDKHDQDERVEGRNGSVPERRDGTENVRSLREKREERREK